MVSNTGKPHYLSHSISRPFHPFSVTNISKDVNVCYVLLSNSKKTAVVKAWVIKFRIKGFTGLLTVLGN